MVPWKALTIFAAGAGASSFVGYVGVGAAAAGLVAGSWLFQKRTRAAISETDDTALDFSFLRPEHKTETGEVRQWENPELRANEKFDRDLAALLVDVSCEAYSQPPACVGFQTRDVVGLPAVTFFNKDILTKTFAGVIVVTIVEARNLRRADIVARASPYAVVSVSEGSYRTRTLQGTNKFIWNEQTCLYISDLEADALCVRVYDDDQFTSDEDMGLAVMGLGKLLQRRDENTPLILPLRGPSGEYSSVTIKCKVRLFSQYAPEDIEELRPSSSTPIADLEPAKSQTDKVDATATATTTNAPMDEPANAKAPGMEGPKAEASKVAISEAEPSKNPGREATVPPVAFIDDRDSDTQVWLRWNLEKRMLVFAFRGTEKDKWKDIITDVRMAHCAFITPTGDILSGVHIHRGIMGAYKCVRRMLARLLYVVTTSNGDGEPWDVIITGHSLGGALATLGAFDVAMFRKYAGNIRSVRMYTYGQPRVGNSKFAEEFDQIVPEAWRMTNKNDVVPGLPPNMPPLFNYRHVGHAVRLDKNGVVAIEPNLTEKAEQDAHKIDAVQAKKSGFSLLGLVTLPIKVLTLPIKILPGVSKPADPSTAQHTTEVNPLKALVTGGIAEHLGDYYKVTVGASTMQEVPAAAS